MLSFSSSSSSSDLPHVDLTASPTVKTLRAEASLLQKLRHSMIVDRCTGLGARSETTIYFVGQKLVPTLPDLHHLRQKNWGD